MTKTQNLFRQEVFLISQEKVIGSIRLAQPVSWVLISLAAFFIAIGLIFFIIFCTISPEVPTQGRIHSRNANGDFDAEAFVSENKIGAINTGQEVIVRFRAFPYQIYGVQRGTVLSVENVIPAENERSSVINGSTFTMKKKELQNPSILIKIGIKYSENKRSSVFNVIKPGMTFDADILGERRKIWQWILLSKISRDKDQ